MKNAMDSQEYVAAAGIYCNLYIRRHRRQIYANSQKKDAAVAVEAVK